MSEAFELHLQVSGGVENLSRIVGTLALLGLTPLRLAAQPWPGGVAVELRFDCEARERALCIARLAAMVCVQRLDEVELPRLSLVANA